LIQGLCKAKQFLTKTDLSTIVAILTSTNVPEVKTEPFETVANQQNKLESSVFDIMNSFITQSLNSNQNLVENKQLIKGL
jgi:hypothetical protein